MGWMASASHVALCDRRACNASHQGVPPRTIMLEADESATGAKTACEPVDLLACRGRAVMQSGSLSPAGLAVGAGLI